MSNKNETKAFTNINKDALAKKFDFMFGNIDVNGVIQWADKIIESHDVFPSEVIDLSLCREMHQVDIVRLLETLSCDVDAQKAYADAFTRLAKRSLLELDEKRFKPEEIAERFYVLSSVWTLEPKHEEFGLWIDDEFKLVGQGISDRKYAVDLLKQYLEEFAGTTK